MKQILIGASLILFGFLVGGVGLATAGVGIGIPIIPIGAYLIMRGGNTIFSTKSESDVQPFEKTSWGGVLLGILIILTGVATSAFAIGIPIIVAGIVWIAYSVWPRSEAPG